MKRIAPVLLSLLAACGTTELAVIDSEGQDHGDIVVLEGAALRAELTQSPARRAPAEFKRLALMWDAEEDANLEFSVSADGKTWSDWRAVEVQHVESEETKSFVGSLEVPAGTLHYRVRQGDGALATFAVIDFLDHDLPQITDGMEPDDADDSFGTISQGLTYGAATVNARSTWGARAPKCRSAMTPYRFTIHHTVTPTNDSMSPQSRLRQIQSYHMDSRGYCDIAYNMLVSRDGRLWEGRGAAVLGGHAANANGGNIGISVIGTYTSVSATSTQVDNIAKLLKGLGARYGIAVNGTTTKGHRQVGTTATACPGDRLYSQIPSIISRANATTTTSTGTTTTTSGTAGCGRVSGSLARGAGVTSCNGRYYFVHQGDGNVVLYNRSTNVATWNSKTNGRATTSLVMQGDGNFVLYNGSTAVWHTGTAGNAGSILAVQDDGNVVIYASGNRAIWNTGTSGR